MAQDQDQDKTEDATPRKRQEAREEGNVAKSQDLSGAAFLVLILIILWPLGPRLWGSLIDVAKRSFGDDLQSTPESVANGVLGDLKVSTALTLADLARGTLPLMVAVMVIGVVINVAQVGLMLTTKKLQPNLGAINPIKGFKKLIFESKTYVGFVMNLMKLGIVAWVAWWAVETEFPRILSLQQADTVSLIVLGARCIFSVGIKVALALLILALLDYGYQKWKHEQDLKMTKEQVKEEMKRMEGDPHIKQRRRQIAMQRSMQRIRKDVPTADVVVTNPTHFAVAIKYDEGSMHAPRVVAKGADLLAGRIRELATLNGVPLVERPPLARALYRTVEVGGEIPEDFYSAVAEILAYVYRLDREMATAAR